MLHHWDIPFDSLGIRSKWGTTASEYCKSSVTSRGWTQAKNNRLVIFCVMDTRLSYISARKPKNGINIHHRSKAIHLQRAWILIIIVCFQKHESSAKPYFWAMNNGCLCFFILLYITITLLFVASWGLKLLSIYSDPITPFITGRVPPCTYCINI